MSEALFSSSLGHSSNLQLDITLNNESIQQLSDIICGDRDAWRDGLAESGVTHEVTYDLSVPDDDD